MLIERQTSISGNLIQLCRFLRKNGFVVSSREETDAMNAITMISLGKEETFRSALKAIFSKSKWQHDQFDGLYDEFWEQLKKAVDSKEVDRAEQSEKPQPAPQPPSLETLKNWLYNEQTDEEKDLASHSDIETLTKKDFIDMSSDEIRLMMALLRKMARRMAHQKSRLKKAAKRHKTLDLKRTFRSNMRAGGELTRLQFSEPKDKKLKLVLICDVSKSMDLYSRFFINLIYAFQNSYDGIETFVFSTALHRVSDLLSNHEFEKAYELISDRVPQWSGGTTIGNCLTSFVDQNSRLLTRKTVFFILSDGWDCGEPAQLRESMHQIHKKSKKVIWLNPLAGNPDFSPEVIGLQSALPFIDVMASAHNLESLRDVLKNLKSGRRRQIS